MADELICSVVDCDKPVRANGCCRPHAMRLWRYGSPTAGGPMRQEPIPSSAPCEVDGCGKKRSKGNRRHCSMHAERLRRHGSVDVGVAQARGVCIIDDCSSSHYGHGYCVAHYKRFKKYGDPFAGGTKSGAVPKWLNDIAIPHDGDECLTFPFSRDTFGYGKLRLPSGNIGAHVYVLRATVGDKPTPKHEACHRCGNGHLGCVNPRHLYWGTRSDNVRDAIRHGTFKPRARGHSEVEIG